MKSMQIDWIKDQAENKNLKSVKTKEEILLKRGQIVEQNNYIYCILKIKYVDVFGENLIKIVRVYRGKIYRPVNYWILESNFEKYKLIYENIKELYSKKTRGPQ